jgi:hypothetical protein
MERAILIGEPFVPAEVMVHVCASNGRIKKAPNADAHARQTVGALPFAYDLLACPSAFASLHIDVRTWQLCLRKSIAQRFEKSNILHLHARHERDMIQGEENE